MYSSKFVAAVLVNGQVQQELANGVVKLPFNVDYVLRFRNKHHDRRAVVKIFIDGENVSGGGYIIPANDKVDIRRHHDKDSTFRFVSLDSPDAVDAGKNGPNPDKIKGVIEARFYLEKKMEVTQHHHHHHYPPPVVYPTPWVIPRPQFPYNDGRRSRSSGGAHQFQTTNYSCQTGDQTKSFVSGETLGLCGFNSATPDSASLDCGDMLRSSTPDVLRDGCTVEGVTSGQRFTSEYIDLETDYVSLKIFLQGFDGPVQTMKPARTKPQVSELESENQRLREQIAALENERLRKELEKLQS